MNRLAETFLLIDGNSIINRAYFGLAGRNTMTAPDKTPTGALFVFLNMYFKYFQELKPDRVLVCFDLKAPTFRHRLYAEYKATRRPMPDDLAVQIPLLKEILDAMGIPRLEMEGFEADDLIGSAANRAESNGWHTFILSGDKDDLQLVSGGTTLLIPFTRNSGTVTETMDPDAVKEKYRVTPAQFVDMKALMGDPSDNIPGVRGIGEKGAAELISKYGSLEALYGSIGEIPGSAAKKLEENREMAFLSRTLSAIRRDIDLSGVIEGLKDRHPDEQRMLELFTRLGFRSLIQKLDLGGAARAAGGDGAQTSEAILRRGIRKAPFRELADRIRTAPLYRFPEGTADEDADRLIDAGGIPPSYFTDEMKEILQPGRREFLCLHRISPRRALLDLGDADFHLLERSDYPALFDLAGHAGIRIVGFGMKQVLREAGSPVCDFPIFDVAVAGYLLNQAESEASFDRIAAGAGLRNGYHPEYFAGKPAASQQTLFDLPGHEQEEPEGSAKDRYDLSILCEIAANQATLLKERGQMLLALHVEMPLVRILAEMERTGFRVDPEVLSDLSGEFTRQIARLESRIYEHAGGMFNINSPRQLGEVLFTRMGLPSGKKGPNGYSTSADVLEKLYGMHPVIREIMDYRERSKLKSTFLDGLAKSIDPADGRVHTTFNQTLTATGRLSSSSPNMQNIPVKTDVGREIRKAFTAAPGCVLADADYSQIELRLLADFSGDAQMSGAFIENDDIHMRTAEEIFDLPREMITPAMRSAAKTVNFSIVYGISDFSLARDLDLSVADAHRYIEEYHRKYPRVKPYLADLLKKAYADGYVETLFKRRRYVGELKSANRNIRSFGERAAMNAPVQGTAADIIKIAMVVLDRRLRSEGSGARLVLQVHDELILEVPEGEAERAAVFLRESMERAVRLRVPLLTDVKVSKNWFGEE